MSSHRTSLETHQRDERLDRIAALSNEFAYNNSREGKSYIDGAPHIKHAALRKLFSKLALEVYDTAAKYADPPRVLDLGAGEGSVTLQFLELGATVKAVDISSQQLDMLVDKCKDYGDRVEVRCQDVNEALEESNEQYDIIALNSFLHHVPDYLSLIDRCTSRLTPNGLIFSFQDPLRFDTVSRTSRVFTDVGYFFWRLSRGADADIFGGLARRLRRLRGEYRDDCHHDNAEFHMVRNGVDHLEIERLLKSRGFSCNIVTYYSSHNTLFQPVGTAIGLLNFFALIATRGPVSAELATANPPSEAVGVSSR